MARPKEFNKRKALRVRVPPGIEARVKAQSKQSGLNQNGWLCQAILAALEKAEGKTTAGPVVRREPQRRQVRGDS